MSSTDTNQASELFELCRSVHEKTGWKPTDWQHDDENGQPLYTSDYLLEKLPPVVQDSYDKKFRHIQMWINGDGEARACYVEPYDKEFRGAYAAKSDSMLKALLKLTIALSEAGELNG